MTCLGAWLLLLGVTYLGGRMVLRCFHRTESVWCPAMIAGSVVLLIYMCVWQVVVVKFALPFSVMKYAGMVYFGVVLIVGIVMEALGVRAKLCGQDKSPVTEKQKRNKAEWMRKYTWTVVSVLVFMLLVVDIQLIGPYFGSDMTVEETVTILETVTVCRYHPATGAELIMGMNLGVKFNCMPGLYAVLCDFTGADAYTFICYFVPVWGLVLNYAAVFVLLGLIFGKQRQEWIGCAMFLYGVLLLFGDYHGDTYAYRLLHQGFCPQVMLRASGSVVLLCVLSAAVRMLCEYRERRTR